MPTDLERLTVLIQANTQSYERAMLRLQAQTEKAIRGSTRSIATLDKSLKGVAATARSLAGIAGLTFGASELPRLLKSVADLGDEADKIGITAEQLQELNFQAEQTGASAEAMAAGLEKFSKNLAEARTGSGELYKLLKANGVALDDLKRMDVNQALAVFVDLLSNGADAADRIKIATIGFGKGGADLALTFAGGSAAVKEFADQAHRLAQIISNETVKSAQDLDDKFTIVLGTISQIVKSGVVEAFHEIGDEIDRINSLITFMQTLGASVQGQPNPMRGDPAADFEEFNRRSQRINQAFQGIKQNAELAAALQKKLSIAPGGDTGTGKPAPTIIPPAAQTVKSTRAIVDHHKAVSDLIADLQRELSLVGATNVQRRISNELHQAGAAATEEDKRKITELVTAIEAEETAQDKLINTLDNIRDAAGGALDAFVQSIANAEGPLAAMKAALQDILQTIIRIAEQALIAKLFGAFGTATLGGFSIPSLSLGGGHAAAAGGGAQQVSVHVTPSPLFDVKIRQSEARSVARGPAVARDNQQRYAVP